MSSQILQKAQKEFDDGNEVNALDLIGENSMADEEVAYLEGSIFNRLGQNYGKSDEAFVFFLASVESYKRVSRYPVYSAKALFDLGERFSSSFYYKKALKEAKMALGYAVDDDKEMLNHIISQASTVSVSELEDLSINVIEQPLELESESKYHELEEMAGLRRFWAGLSAEEKKVYMKVSLSQMKVYFEGRESGSVESLKQVIKYVKKHGSWILWICRLCSKRFSTSSDCKHHLEVEHITKPSLMPQVSDKVLENLKSTRNDGTDMVCKTVNSLCLAAGVREKLEFDSDFSHMLIDKRLLRGKVNHVDKGGIVSVFDHKVYYGNTHPQGDYFLTWLDDDTLEHVSRVEFPDAIKKDKLALWMAVLRALQLSCRTLQEKYVKKKKLLECMETLDDVRRFSKARFCDPNESMNEKISLMDSKILLVEATRVRLLDALTTLSVFDYRSYVQQPVKEFVLALLMSDSERGRN